jgi:hypothetical protein
MNYDQLNPLTWFSKRVMPAAENLTKNMEHKAMDLEESIENAMESMEHKGEMLVDPSTPTTVVTPPVPVSAPERRMGPNRKTDRRVGERRSSVRTMSNTRSH